jgi:hypothetical protein
MSNEGDVSGNHGYYDSWIARIDASGILIWQKCLGGSDYEYTYEVQQRQMEDTLLIRTRGHMMEMSQDIMVTAICGL